MPTQKQRVQAYLYGGEPISELDHHSLAAPGARADMEAFIARRVQERANGCTCPPWHPCRNDSAYGAQE